MFRARRFAFISLLIVLHAAGCSTSRLAVDVMTPVLENTAKAAMRSNDPVLVGDALPASILLVEGMLETHPGQAEVARLAAMLYFSYGFAFVEAEDPERASALYERGSALGWLALAKPAAGSRLCRTS